MHISPLSSSPQLASSHSAALVNDSQVGHQSPTTWEQTIHDAARVSQPDHLGQMDRQHELLAWVDNLNQALDNHNPDASLSQGVREDMQTLVDNLRDAPSSIPNWLLREVDLTADRMQTILDNAQAPGETPADPPSEEPRSSWAQSIHDAAQASQPEHLGEMDRQRELLGWVENLNRTLDNYNPDVELTDASRSDLETLIGNLRDAPSSIPDWLLGKVEQTADRMQALVDGTGSTNNPPPVEGGGQVPGGGLQAHEQAGSHLIERHVGKTAAELMDRLRRDNISAASSFADLQHAEHFVASLIEQNQSRIDSWVDGQGGYRLVLEGRFDAVTGISVERGSDHADDVHSVKLVLERSQELGIGYRIVTGYPSAP